MPSAPWPLIEISGPAVSDDNRSNLRSALLELVAETPGLDFSTDSTTGQFIFKAGDKAAAAQMQGVIFAFCPVNRLSCLIFTFEINRYFVAIFGGTFDLFSLGRPLLQ